MPIKKIRVLVVDDSMLFRKLLIDHISSLADMEVVGFAINAYDARQKIPQLKPDVVTLDVEMPGMNGIEFLKQLIPQNPIPVILVSSLNLNVFEALSAGAVDFVRKPDMGPENTTKIFLNTLAAKVKIAAKSNVVIPAAVRAPAPVVNSAPVTYPILKTQTMILAIGASTGGTEATLSILKEIPANCPGILITQHMPEGFTKMYAERLNRICKMEVREAAHGDLIRPGLALLAPGNYQMRVVPAGAGQYKVTCTQEEKVSGHMPSVDVLFSSMAEHVKRNGVGVILTGMGQDGAEGLLKMRNAGAYTIGQNKETCVVYGMPMVAYNIGAVCTQTSLDRIPETIKNYLCN